MINPLTEKEIHQEFKSGYILGSILSTMILASFLLIGHEYFSPFLLISLLIPPFFIWRHYFKNKEKKVMELKKRQEICLEYIKDPVTFLKKIKFKPKEIDNKIKEIELRFQAEIKNSNWSVNKLYYILVDVRKEVFILKFKKNPYVFYKTNCGLEDRKEVDEIVKKVKKDTIEYAREYKSFYASEFRAIQDSIKGRKIDNKEVIWF